MNVTVLMASGEVDEFEHVADTVQMEGELHVLGHLPDDGEVPDDVKTVDLSREIDQGPSGPPMIKTETFQVLSIYATGMWIKVDFL